MNQHFTNEKEGVFSLQDLKFILRIIQNNWWIPFIVLPVFILAAYFYTYKITPIYQVTGEILLQSNDSYYKSSVISEENYLAATYMDNSNQQRIIQSYDLVKKVVEGLWDRLEVSYYIVGKVRTTEQFSGMPFKVEVLYIRPDLYEQKFDFKITGPTNYEIRFEYNNNKYTFKGHFNELLSNDFFSFKISLVSNSLKDVETLKEIYYQFSIHQLESLVQKVRANLKIENPQYTNFIVINHEDILPERSKLILDSLISSYIYSRIKQRLDLNENTIRYIDKQLDEISLRLKHSLDTLMDFKKNKSIINLTWEETSTLARISKLEEEISNLNLQLQALDDMEKYIIENKDPQFLPPNTFIFEQSGYLNKAIQELYNKQFELNQILRVAKPNNITVLEIHQQIKRLKNEMLVYINNSRLAIRQKKENIYNEFSRYLQDAKTIDPKQQELNNITRLLRINENIYTFLLEKRANTLIARASIVPDVKVVELPRNMGVVKPDVNSINKRFLISGLGLSLILIIIRALWFVRIESLEHLSELTPLPSLGIIPKIKHKKEKESDELFIVHLPNSPASDAIRAIRANLQYALVNEKMKTLLFTSHLPSEGKTFLSVNMSILLARSGKKTLLMELDLHKPRIYQALHIPQPEKGVTTLLNQIHTLDEVIFQHPSIENLDVLFAGVIPPNPSDYIVSEKLKNTIEEIKTRYDYIIMDTPPAGLLSDSVFLMQYANAVLFVINTEKSSFHGIRFINQVVKNNQIKNVYLILNAVKTNLKRYYYPGYGYSYGYGYGYGYRKK